MILIWLVLIPLLSSILIFSIPNIPRWITIILSSVPFFILSFENTTLLGNEIKYNWFSALSIDFFLKIDSLSLIFLFLTAIIIPICIISISLKTVASANILIGLILLLESLLVGFFTARDLFLFVFFWEAMLLPLYFIIGLWGGTNRQQAALKFIIYMIAGSVLMIAGALFLYFAAGETFNMDQLMTTNNAYPIWVFAIFLLAFAVKTPLFPFHAWLPDVYTQASTEGSILLAALLSKAGVYGFLRIGLEIFPTAMNLLNPYLIWLAIIGVLYGGLAAWSQKDFKRLIAYSSFSHVNLLLAGVFIWNQTANEGAIIQAFNHGITITALFLNIGWLEERIRTRSIGSESGLAHFMPYLCWLTLFFIISSVAVPGTNNFIGEILILFGIFSSHPWQAAILSLTVIISVIYMLRFMQKVYFESPVPFQENWVDLKGKEFAIALPLIILTLWIGIYPAPLLQQTKQATSFIAEKRQ